MLRRKMSHFQIKEIWQEAVKLFAKKENDQALALLFNPPVPTIQQRNKDDYLFTMASYLKSLNNPHVALFLFQAISQWEEKPHVWNAIANCYQRMAKIAYKKNLISDQARYLDLSQQYVQKGNQLALQQAYLLLEEGKTESALKRFVKMNRANACKEAALGIARCCAILGKTDTQYEELAYQVYASLTEKYRAYRQGDQFHYQFLVSRQDARAFDKAKELDIKWPTSTFSPLLFAEHYKKPAIQALDLAGAPRFSKR